MSLTAFSKMAELLIDHGVDVDVPDGDDTALTLSAFYCKVDLVKFLLEHGANAEGEVEINKGSCSTDSDADDIERLLQEWKPQK